MSDPLEFLVGAMRRGADPRQMISSLARSDPRAQQVERILAGKTPQQQRQIVTTMYKERGLDIESVARSLGISIPSNR